jgi:hypothetical protein
MLAVDRRLILRNGKTINHSLRPKRHCAVNRVFREHRVRGNILNLALTQRNTGRYAEALTASLVKKNGVFTMSTVQHRKAGGLLFILAGGAFIVAGVLGEQRAFFGVAAAFVGIGIAFILQARRKQ